MALVTRSRQARLDLFALWQYRAERRGADNADELLDTLETTFQTLADMPDIGSPRDYTPPGCLAFPKDGYMVFYRKEGEDIQIVRVFHGKQDIENIF